MVVVFVDIFYDIVVMLFLSCSCCFCCSCCMFVVFIVVFVVVVFDFILFLFL